MAHGTKKFNLVRADAHFFFQLAKGTRKRAGIFSIKMATRQGDLIAPGVTFAVRFLNCQDIRFLKIKDKEKRKRKLNIMLTTQVKIKFLWRWRKTVL